MRSTFQILALFLSVVFLNASSAGAQEYFNHALSTSGGVATQVNQYKIAGFDETKLGHPNRAIDGNTDGLWGGASVSHTRTPSVGNWWQVELLGSKKIDKIEIWNRTDLSSIKRLMNFYVFISEDKFVLENGNDNKLASKKGMETSIKQIEDNGGSIYFITDGTVDPYTNSTTLTSGYTDATINTIDISPADSFTTFTLDDTNFTPTTGRYVRIQLVGSTVPRVNKQLHMAEVKVLEDVTPGLSVIKESNKVGERVNVNDVITYTYTVKNTGKSTISDVGLSDDHRGEGAAPVPTFSRIVENVDPQTDLDTTITDGKMASIGPGDTVEFTATYTVTQDDIDLLQ